MSRKIIGVVKTTCFNCGPEQHFNYIQEEMEIGGKKRIIIKETCTTCDCIIWERFTEYTMPRRKIDTFQFGTVSNTSSIR